jgi:hypothetical protein
MGLTNQGALDALDIFRQCQKREFNFKLKYAMARDIDILSKIERATAEAKSIKNLPGFKEFDKIKKTTFDKFAIDGSVSNDKILEFNRELETQCPEFCELIKENDEQYKEFLESEIDADIKIYKIKYSYFPKETDIDIGKIFHFIDDDENEVEKCTELKVPEAI